MFKALSKRITNSFSLWLAIITYGVLYLSLVAYFFYNGRWDIGYATFNSIAVGIAAGVALLVVAASFLRFSQVGDEIEKRYWFPLGILIGLGYGFVAGITGYLMSTIFSIAFRNMTFDFISAPFLLASFGALVAYFVAESLVHFDRKHFTYLISGVFLSGFFLAAVRTRDNFWWRGSVCSLGMPINGHFLYFNFTLVLTGLLLILFSVYLAPTMVALREKKLVSRKNATFLKWFYLTLSTMLVLVGLFPYGVNEWMNKFHIYVGDAIFVFFAIFLAASAFIFKKFPLRFKITSYVLLAIGFSLYPLHYQIGYLEYAVMELMMILAMVIWFIIFVRTMTVLTKEEE
jgi:hypothetical membrane protein